MIEQVFDHRDSGIGLWPGESTDIETALAAEDRLAIELTCGEWADGEVPDEQHFLPTNLEEIRVGPFLAAIVSVVDPKRLNGHDAVRLMQARARLAAHDEAGKLEAMVEVAYSPPGHADSPVERTPMETEYVAAEIAAALTLTRRAAESELDRAVSLCGRLHRVWNRFSGGDLDLARVKMFDKQLGHLPQATVDQVLDRVLGDAPNLTTGQLRARLARLVLETDPDGSASSFQQGLEERSLVTYANPDLTGTLAIVSGDPTRIAAARANIECLARGLQGPAEPRNLEQLRHDVAVDLLAGNCHHHQETGGAGVHVTIPAATLEAAANDPGVLDGYGPVTAEIARKTVFENVDGEWVFTVTDNGRPIATGTLTRRPTTSQRRQVEAWYPTCVAPGCRHPATESDIDHRQPWAQTGPTSNNNLAPLCRYHHQAKTTGSWKLERQPDGSHQWTSPLGHIYIRDRDPPD